MVSYESIYNGVQSYTPTYKPTGYQAEVSNISMAMDARTANQLGELRTKINPGQKEVEVGTVQADAWESVPEQHIDEMNRTMKLAGVKPTFHAPVMEVSGVGQQGWDEIAREGAEKQLTSAVLRGNRLSDDGNINVTIHSSGGLPELYPKFKTDKKDKDGKPINKEGPFWVINEQSGQITPLPKSKKYLSESGKFTGKVVEDNAQQQLKKINEDAWTGKLADVNRLSSYGESELGQALKLQKRDIYDIDPEKEEAFKQGVQKIYEKNFDPNTIENPELRENIREFRRKVDHGRVYVQESYRSLKELFDQAYPTTEPGSEDREKLKEFANEITPIIKGGLQDNPERVLEFAKVIENGIKTLSRIKHPQMYKPLQDFVLDKTSDTFSNVAMNAYKEYKDKAPMLSIENPPGGTALSTGEDLAQTIEQTQEKFAAKLVKEFGISKGEAKRIADEKIGATWDVGHINMMRKFGYTEKDLVKDTERIAPYVKKVHLSDNFGMEHTELPMGMGNVPLKKMMDKIEKKGFKGPKVVEAGNWWQYFADHGGGNPFKESIEALDSPIYAMKEGPTWSQYEIAGSYFSGHGPINPPQHHSLYGAGFTALPAELGGQMPGAGGDRFSGTPMQ